MGGSGIIKTLGGTQAPSWITALAKDAADAVGVSPPAHVFLVLPGTKEPNTFASEFTDNGMSVAVTQELEKGCLPSATFTRDGLGRWALTAAIPVLPKIEKNFNAHLI